MASQDITTSSTYQTTMASQDITIPDPATATAGLNPSKPTEIAPSKPTKAAILDPRPSDPTDLLQLLLKGANQPLECAICNETLHIYTARLLPCNHSSICAPCGETLLLHRRPICPECKAVVEDASIGFNPAASGGTSNDEIDSNASDRGSSVGSLDDMDDDESDFEDPDEDGEDFGAAEGEEDGMDGFGLGSVLCNVGNGQRVVRHYDECEKPLWC